MADDPSQYRPLSSYEETTIRRLLDASFPGRDELRQQAEAARARTIADAGDHRGTIELRVESGPVARASSSVPVWANAFDSDGVPIEVLLHVRDGLMYELEVFKADGSELLRLPPPDEMKVEMRD